MTTNQGNSINLQTGDVDGDVTIGNIKLGDNINAGGDVAITNVSGDLNNITNHYGIAIEDIEDLPAEEGEPPYKGLSYFTEKDADRFFGREAITSTLVNRLHDIHFLAVIGASGSGKSSLVRAGLIPVMKRSKKLPDGIEPPLGMWVVSKVTPTARPFTKLATVLFPEEYGLQAIIDEEATENVAALKEVLSEVKLKRGHKRLLFIDQFEEIFTLCKDETVRQAYIDNLLTAADKSCKIVITMRADFYPQCLRYEGLRKVLKEAQEPIGAISAEELALAIWQPAELAQWKLQKGLVKEILEDVDGNDRIWDIDGRLILEPPNNSVPKGAFDIHPQKGWFLLIGVDAHVYVYDLDGHEILNDELQDTVEDEDGESRHYVFTFDSGYFTPTGDAILLIRSAACRAELWELKQEESGYSLSDQADITIFPTRNETDILDRVTFTANGRYVIVASHPDDYTK